MLTISVGLKIPRENGAAAFLVGTNNICQIDLH